MAQIPVCILMHYDRANACFYLLWHILKTRYAFREHLFFREPHMIECKQRAEQRFKEIVLVLEEQEVVIPESRLLESPQTIQ